MLHVVVVQLVYQITEKPNTRSALASRKGVKSKSNGQQHNKNRKKKRGKFVKWINSMHTKNKKTKKQKKGGGGGGGGNIRTFCIIKQKN